MVNIPLRLLRAKSSHVSRLFTEVAVPKCFGPLLVCFCNRSCVTAGLSPSVALLVFRTLINVPVFQRTFEMRPRLWLRTMQFVLSGDLSNLLGSLRISAFT